MLRSVEIWRREERGQKIGQDRKKKKKKEKERREKEKREPSSSA